MIFSGLIAVLRPNCRQSDSMRLVVATTHLLFNEKRGEIKLVQLAMMLAALEKVTGLCKLCKDYLLQRIPNVFKPQFGKKNPPFPSSPSLPLPMPKYLPQLVLGRVLGRKIGRRGEGLSSYRFMRRL